MLIVVVDNVNISTMKLSNKGQNYQNAILAALRRISTKTFLVIVFSLTFFISGCYYSRSPRSDYTGLEDQAPIEKLHKKPKNLKYILLWTPRDYAPLDFFKVDQRAFIENRCSFTSCFVTTDRNLLGDVTKFDAIAFNGRNLGDIHHIGLPKARSDHQKYVFLNMESADNYPVCDPAWDGFFNWTGTYKLDSDIPFHYIQIRNLNGQVVGPKRNMSWAEYPGSDGRHDYRQNKTKAVAWFVSNCKSRSQRGEVAARLADALKKYGLAVDVYGSCGQLSCPRFDDRSDCGAVLERDYFFYLSFENSLAEDYVTEKLLTALQHGVVPIVLGGADYSRFLPPGSYLDATKTSSEELAATIDRSIRSPSEYSKFFRWRSLYRYRDPSTSDSVCAACAALHDRASVPSTYTHFRRWWNPNFERRCAESKSLFGFS